MTPAATTVLDLPVHGPPVLEPVLSGPCLRGAEGTVIPLHVGCWSAPADAVERRRLADLQGPVIDIGCGPGRLVVALSERGVPALGIDASPVAVGQAVHRQAAALVRSVFDPLPGTGRWATALLFDGNIGIGGDPERLLARVAELLACGGRAIVETGPHGMGVRRFAARVERGDVSSDWFPWAQVGADAIGDLARDAGMDLVQDHVEGDRWFVELERRPVH